MMGICAQDAVGGIAALKAWTGDLGHQGGSCTGWTWTASRWIRRRDPCSSSTTPDSGDAFLSGYGGEYRGVLFTPELGDGAFRQYGYLPLDLPGGGDESAEWYSSAVMTSETNGARDVDVSGLELDQNRRRLGSDASWNRSSHTRVSTIYSRHASGRSRASHRSHACIVAKEMWTTEEKKWT